MKLGYPGINLGLGCTSSHTFRLASYTQETFVRVTGHNLDCLEQTITWNIAHGLLFHRISSDIIPFASHPVLDVEWLEHFRGQFERIGALIAGAGMRISMHPGHFVALTSRNQTTYENAVRELQYHADFMTALGLDRTHKFQIHLGGIHGDEAASRQVFIDRYNALPQAVRDRLVIENDERFVSVADGAAISQACGIPVLFDTLHHEVKNNGESMQKGLALAMATWQPEDGVPMIDYSNQDTNKRIGAHAVTVNVDKFRRFVQQLKGKDIDIMFEIKNKEASALQAKIVVESLV